MIGRWQLSALFSALMLLVGQWQVHPARKNSATADSLHWKPV